MVNYIESTIPQEVQKKESLKGYGWNNFITESIFKTLFEGTATFLGRVKSKDQPVVLKFLDQDGKFHFAGIVEYHAEESNNGVDAGAWSLSYTLDENDIDEKNSKIYNFPDDTMSYTVLADIGYSKWGITFIYRPKDDNNAVCEGSAQELIIDCIDSFKDYMKANVTQDPFLEFTDYFSATAEINGDSVYISITPSALLKQHIKDDVASDEESKKLPERTTAVA